MYVLSIEYWVYVHTSKHSMSKMKEGRAVSWFCDKTTDLSLEIRPVRSSRESRQLKLAFVMPFFFKFNFSATEYKTKCQMICLR